MVESEIRDHVSQHEAISELPLITESAEITAVEKMDKDRRREVIDTIHRWLATHNLTDRYADLIESESLMQLPDRLLEDDYPRVARQVRTLATRYDRPKPMLVRARFQTEQSFDFIAGQYVGLKYRGTPRAYSLASSPTDDDFEICVRRVPGGKLSPQLCDDLAVGDSLTIRGPYGELVLGEQSGRDIVFLATGTGVAPFKAMIDFLFETGRDTFEDEQRNIWLFLGAAWRDDLPYLEALTERQHQHDNFHFVPCLSREPVLSDWDGEADYVQHALLKHVDSTVVGTDLGKPLERRIRRDPDSGIDERIDPANIDVYACGINAMVYSLVRAVEGLGVPPDRIDSEGFG